MSISDPPGNDVQKPVNDNGAKEDAPSDPRILRIAAAIGRQIAREQIRLRRPVNDNGSSEPD